MRIARLFDDVDPTRGPRMASDHPVLGPAEANEFLRYLNQGAPALTTMARMYDVVDPSKGEVVPLSFSTDGDWVWSHGSAYYLKEYGLALEPAFAASIQARGFVMPPVSEEQQDLAARTVTNPGVKPVWTVRH
jgi:hypothetical protein